MAVSVDQVAARHGLSVDEVLAVCRRSNILVWGGSTPLDERELATVTEALGGVPAGPGAPQLPPPWRRPGRCRATSACCTTACCTSGGGRSAAASSEAYSSSSPSPWAWRSGGRCSPTRPRRSEARDAIADVEGSDFNDEVDDEIAAYALVVGDCFDDNSSGTAATEVVEVLIEEVPCTSPHDAEVYALVTHPAPAGEAYPGDDAMIQFADEQCAATFESFVGTPRDLSSLDIYFTFPIDVAFERLDERQIVCSVYALDLSKLTGSMAGSRR